MSEETCREYLEIFAHGSSNPIISKIRPRVRPCPYSSQTYLRDGVGGAGVSEGGSRRAEGGQGSHNLGGVCDILKGGGASGDGENGGSGELHFDCRVGY